MGFLDMIKGIPSMNELKGSFGEYLAKFYLKTMNDALVLHDVVIDGAEDMTSQIDLVVIGHRGIYVVEVKMYTNARIYGDGRKSRWYYYLGGKKYEIYSPIMQNKKHIEYLKEFLKDFGDIPFFNVILLVCEDIKVNDIQQDPRGTSTVVGTSLSAMNRGMQRIAKEWPVALSAEQQQAIHDYIVAHQHSGKTVRAEHKEKVKQQNREREEIAKKNLCPYCKTELVLRKGKYGEFYGCSNYPKCRYIKKDK